MQACQYDTVVRAIEYLRGHRSQCASLDAWAAAIGMRKNQLQQVLDTWVGGSFKGAAPLLFASRHSAVLPHYQESEREDSFDCCRSPAARSPSAVITSAENHAFDSGMNHGITATPFGDAVIGWTARGVCFLQFCLTDCRARLAELQALWPQAQHTRQDAEAAEWARKIFNPRADASSIQLLIHGTAFQRAVWAALLTTAPAQLLSYRQLAELAGRPNAQRAVGSAMAANKIAFLIPCHRVIRETGELSSYRWGKSRKWAMQIWEAAQVEQGTLCTLPWSG